MAKTTSIDESLKEFYKELESLAIEKLNEKTDEIQKDMESQIRKSVEKFYGDYTPLVYHRAYGLYNVYAVTKELDNKKTHKNRINKDLSTIEMSAKLRFSFDPSLLSINPFDFTYHDRYGNEHKGHYDGDSEYAYQSAFIEGKHGGGRFMMKQSDSPWQDIGIYALYKYNAQVIGL